MNAFVIEAEKLHDNIKQIIAKAASRKIYAVIKGDGYGFGLCTYAKILVTCGINALAVTEPYEVAALREAGIDCEILMIRATAIPGEIEELLRHNAILTVGSNEDAVTINGIAGRLGTKAKVHIKIDTGMGRYGYLLNDIEKIGAVYDYMDNIEPLGIYTHLNAAFGSKKKTLAQIESFKALVAELKRRGYEAGCVHFANSSAFYRFSDMDFLDAVRIGSAFTGRIPYPCKTGLNRIGYLESEICEIRWLEKGATVGYGGAYRAKSPKKIAIIPLGYSHGFGVEKIRDTYRFRDGVRYVLQDIKRTLSGEKVYVTVNGKRARVLGHIGMLHTVVDITDLTCKVGDNVQFKVNPLYVNANVVRKYI
ncbi:MAG: alanine racemase [Clostridia bacterium]|nr:alanine racemase [Clostridia bacterium]